jgi:hypothetical protein
MARHSSCSLSSRVTLVPTVKPSILSTHFTKQVSNKGVYNANGVVIMLVRTGGKPYALKMSYDGYKLVKSTTSEVLLVGFKLVFGTRHKNTHLHALEHAYLHQHTHFD